MPEIKPSYSQILNKLGIYTPFHKRIPGMDMAKRTEADALRLVYGFALQGYVAILSNLPHASAIQTISHISELTTPDKVTRKEAERFIGLVAESLCLFYKPTDTDKECDKKVEKISALGLAALGILRQTVVENYRDADTKHHALQALIKDPVAQRIYNDNLDIFDGHSSIRSDISNAQNCSWKSLLTRRK